MNLKTISKNRNSDICDDLIRDYFQPLTKIRFNKVYQPDNHVVVYLPEYPLFALLLAPLYGFLVDFYSRGSVSIVCHESFKPYIHLINGIQSFYLLPSGENKEVVLWKEKIEKIRKKKYDILYNFNYTRPALAAAVAASLNSEIKLSLWKQNDRLFNVILDYQHSKKENFINSAEDRINSLFHGLFQLFPYEFKFKRSILLDVIQYLIEHGYKKDSLLVFFNISPDYKGETIDMGLIDQYIKRIKEKKSAFILCYCDDGNFRERLAKSYPDFLFVEQLSLSEQILPMIAISDYVISDLNSLYGASSLFESNQVLILKREQDLLFKKCQQLKGKKILYDKNYPKMDLNNV